MEIVELSQTAISQVSRLLAKDNKDPKTQGLRLAVKGGGCSGLSYDMKFDEIKDKDLIQEFENFKIVVDPKSAIYVKGMIIDFDDSLTGKGFTFKNPNATDTCGCGESFSVF